MLRVSTLLLLCSWSLASVVVHIPGQGKVEADIWRSHEGREFLAFLKVPYARPPIGKFRFARPQPPVPWLGVRHSGLGDGVSCAQFEPILDVRTASIVGVGAACGMQDALYFNLNGLSRCLDQFWHERLTHFCARTTWAARRGI